MNQIALRNRLLQYACVTMVAAAGARTLYASVFEPSQFAGVTNHGIKMGVAYGIFAVAYALMPQDGSMTLTPRRLLLLAAQALAALTLVWIYPSFIVTCLLVVVAWQFALLTEFRVALSATLVQVIALGAIECGAETHALSVILPPLWASSGARLLVALSCGGFQLFAVCAAQLLRSEMAARDTLARANAELKAAQVLLGESARMGERLRIARDLHDVMGHSLTSLTIHLDVASRLTTGPAAEHLTCAREVSSDLLDQVRSVVGRFRVPPIDLRTALQSLANSVKGLTVRVVLPDDLAVLDPARADTILRCAQEAITNTLRHAGARQLVIEVQENGSGVIVMARDDGRGGQFVIGHGLSGMRERFEMFGGSLSIASQEGEGFSIRGIIPRVGVAH
ncbi:MAG TPA: sensor histidine kinase [Steroidobacteraceae bacterium]|nr:sensor histidine kinase [Steroidobacteraceae bacterium]